MLRIIIVLLFAPIITLAQVGIGTPTPNASAQLDVNSTTKGFLPPRMTQVQRQNINSPTDGLMVYQIDGTAGLWYYAGNGWIYIINSSSATLPITNGGTGETTIPGVKSILGLNGANVAIGSDAGTTTQGSQAIAIGSQSGKITQGVNAIAIGAGSGRNSQGLSAIGIGYVAGDVSQGSNGIAIGSNAAQANQNTEAVAIGYAAGQYSQGANAVAIGSFAGNSGQTAGSIAINASGAALNPTTAGLYINPIRSNAGTNSYLNYNATTKEVTHSSGLAAASVSTTTIIDGAVTDNKIETVSGSKVTGNISGNAANVTGTVAVANGGTGATTLTANNLLVGNGTSAVSLIAPGTSGNVLVSNGASWSSGSASSSFIQNQTASDQTAGFRVNGDGLIGGKIGIGTNSPSTALHIQNSNNIGSGDPSSNSVPSIYVYNNNNSSTTAHSIISTRTGGSGGGKPYISLDVTSFAGYSLGINNPTDQFIINTDWNFNVSNAAKNALIINETGQSRVIIPNSGGSYSSDFPAGWGGGLSTYDMSCSGIYYNTLLQRSDERLKNSVKSLDDVAINKYLQLNSVSYYWNKGKTSDDKLQYGLIAQQVEKIFPEMVFTANDAMQTKSINYQALHALSLKVIQSQQFQIEKLKKKQEDLNSRLLELESKIK